MGHRLAGAILALPGHTVYFGHWPWPVFSRRGLGFRKTLSEARHMAYRKKSPLYPERFEILFPVEMPPAIRIAAAAALTSPSQYIRTAVLEQLRRDGINLQRCRVRRARNAPQEARA